MVKALTIGKDERISGLTETDRIFKKGRKFTLGPFRVFYLLVEKEDPKKPGLKLGVGVSNKMFSRAVDRNRVKRLAREAWRLQRTDLSGSIPSKQQCHVFLLYNAKEIGDFNSYKELIKKILDKLKSLVS